MTRVRVVVHKRVKLLETLAAALLAGALMLAASSGARAESDESGAVSAGWETINRVLEIPQVCAKDGVVVTCKQPETEMSPADGARANAEGSSQDDSSTEEVSGVDDSDGAPAWGTLQDYENQAVASGPVAAYVPVGPGATLPPAAYAVPVRPVVPMRPMAAPTRLTIFGPATSPWMSSPRIATGPPAMPLRMPGRVGLPMR